MNIYDATEQAYKNGYEAGVKEFAERLTDKICDSVERSSNNPDGNDYYVIDVYTDINNLVKEMVGDSK